MSFQHVSDPLLSVLGNSAKALSQDKDDTPLSKKYGTARTVFTLGLNGLGVRAAGLGCQQEQIAQIMSEAERQFAKGLALCESPIERMILAALMTSRWPPAYLTIPPLVHDGKVDERLPGGDIIIVPQMAFVRYRFDFGLIIEWEGIRHIIAIECGGADYHEYVKDRGRELFLASWGIPVFRFTGSEIHKKPHALVDYVVSKVCDWRLQKFTNLALAALELAERRLSPWDSSPP